MVATVPRLLTLNRGEAGTLTVPLDESGPYPGDYGFYVARRVGASIEFTRLETDGLTLDADAEAADVPYTAEESGDLDADVVYAYAVRRIDAGNESTVALGNLYVFESFGTVNPSMDGDGSLMFNAEGNSGLLQLIY